MVFSSVTFIFLFLPSVLALYYLCPAKQRNVLLTVASLFFFFWGSGKQTLLILFSICINFIVARIIDKTEKQRLRAYTLGIGITVNLLLLFYFKYADFFVGNINSILSLLGIEDIPLPKVLLPIGISFFTFQSISFLIDVYRKNAEANYGLIDFAMYISLFPQLIAGPIVRYKDIHTQIKNRKTRVEQFRDGVQRFLFGLAKKVIIADSMGVIADLVFNSDTAQISTGAAWIGLFAYSFQIYFDFSGYSDMAIGLGKMFGFNFLENFNYPYISKSITEFWRRWHISLSSCFKDYLYIPLGGSRGSNLRTFFNLYIVFFFCGLWHGASWTFVVWGLFHGTILTIERTRFKTLIESLPSILQRTYCLLVVMIGWVIFRSDSIDYAIRYIKTLFSFSGEASKFLTTSSLLDTEAIIIFCLAALGSTQINAYVRELWKIEISKTVNFYKKFLYSFAGESVACGFFIFIFVYSIGKLAAQSYNPFIYFKF